MQLTTVRFSYDNWEQLNKFTTGTDSYTYKYDPEGLGSKKNTPTTTARYHCNNNGQVIAESSAAGQVIAESSAAGQITAQTIWGHQALARKMGLSSSLARVKASSLQEYQ